MMAAVSSRARRRLSQRWRRTSGSVHSACRSSRSSAAKGRRLRRSDSMAGSVGSTPGEYQQTGQLPKRSMQPVEDILDAREALARIALYLDQVLAMLQLGRLLVDVIVQRLLQFLAD